MESLQSHFPRTMRRRSGPMSRATDGCDGRGLFPSPGGCEGEPCLDYDGSDDAGEECVGKIAEVGLPVCDVSPGDEDGDGGEGYISALQGHNRAGAARSGILLPGWRVRLLSC